MALDFTATTPDSQAQQSEYRFAIPGTGAAASRRARWHSRVSTEHVGKLLTDDVEDKVAALFLLAVKCSMPSDHALNMARVLRTTGIGKHRFKAGLRALKSAGLLDRRQPSIRNYAVEKLAPVDRDSTVRIPVESALRVADPAVIAFSMVAVLAPESQPANGVAKRLDITSPTTVRRLVRDAEALGLISVTRGPRGATMVGRPQSATPAAAKPAAAPPAVAKPVAAAPPVATPKPKSKKRRWRQRDELICWTEAIYDMPMYHTQNNRGDFAYAYEPAAPSIDNGTRATEDSFRRRAREHHGIRTPAVYTKWGQLQVESLADWLLEEAEDRIGGDCDWTHVEVIDEILEHIAAAESQGKMVNSLGFIAARMHREIYYYG